MVITTLFIGAFEANIFVFLVMISLGLALLLAGIIIMYKHPYQQPVPGAFEIMPKKSPDEDLEHALTQLGRNYELQRKQTMQGFVFALIMSGLGLVVILVGALGEMFGLTSQTGNISVIAGIIIEFINATALLVYRQNFQRLNAISDRLNDTWKILTAFKQVKQLSNKEHADEVRSKLIFALAKTQIEAKEVSNP